MTARPLVSIVIPCFNQAAYLGEAIESAISQCYPCIEVIVVNDGSTDNTSEIAGLYPDVTLITQQNQGLSAARNRGLRESRGAMLVFLDADDRLLPGAIRAGVTRLIEHPRCAFAYGQYRFIHADGSFMRSIEREPGSGDDYIDFLHTNRVGMHATVMYRREVFDQVGGFNSSLRACEDLELYLRIVRRFPVTEHPALVAEYRRHPESISSNNRNMLESVLGVLERERARIEDDPARLDALNYGISRVIGFYSIRLIRCALPPRVNRNTWRRALADLWWLLRTHPEGLLHLRLWLPEILESTNRGRREYASA